MDGRTLTDGKNAKTDVAFGEKLESCYPRWNFFIKGIRMGDEGLAEAEVNIKRNEWLLRPVEFALKWGLLGAVVLLLVYGAAKLLNASFEVKELFGQKVFIKINNNLNLSNERLAVLEERLKQLTQNFEQMSQDLEQGGIETVSASEIREVKTEDREVIESVLTYDPVSGEGYVWIGSWNQYSRVWTDGTVESLDSLAAPDYLAGQSLKLIRDVNLRSNFPAPVDRGYYQAVTSKGVAKQGTSITVLAKPRPYARGQGIQYWAKVSATYEPKEVAQ